MDYTRATTVLRTWAVFGTRLRPQGPPAVRWDAAQRLIDATRTKLKGDAERLRQLLQQSQKLLAPLEDPLQVDLGLHRWLSGEREEAYSDWLQWVLLQIRRPDLVFCLFGLPPPEDWQSWADVPPQVHREVWVAEGHPGQSGRFDIVVDYATHARLIVEVKKTGAEEAHTAKGAGYRRSEPGAVAVLLATAGESPLYEGDFRFCS